MSIELDKTYDPKQNEDKIYRTWEKSGYFNPDKLPQDHKKPYSITMAPPNVTGSLHMGHALENTLIDILIRQKRMAGYKTLWVPGTDHAGIATQNVVEKELKKQGLTRHDLGREKFLKKVWAWREKYGDIILEQLKKLGCSCDWTRTAFTMNPDYQETVKKVFLHYYEKKWIYQGERVINWCPRCQTSLSDLELEHKEEKSHLWHIKYPLVQPKNNLKHITVATTRPETMLGDTAVAVHPQDKKYKELIGQKIILPLVNREIPIVADQVVDPEFGTGAVKVTPAHSMVDAEIAQRHNLPFIKIISDRGRMTKQASQRFASLNILDARQKVIEQLKKQGLLEKIEDYSHQVPHCDRCHTAIEPLISKQWFLKMDKLAQKAIKAVKDGQIKFHPQRWEKVYFDWLNNIKDWCISRQLWWGHKIPIKGTDDVLDTWFSSALWPLATLGWPEKTKDLEKFYPTSLIASARDILHLWITRMVFSGLEFTKKVPFKDVLIHATILTKQGKRMSKSLGTGIDPLELISQYGSDATRFGLVYQSLGGQAIHFSEENILMGKKFANKIWNASRFVLGQTKDVNKLATRLPNKLTPADKLILKQLKTTIEKVNKDLDNFRFGQAAHLLYDFFWHDFCDKYLETAKKQNNPETKQILIHVLLNSLKLLHPFMPFVTEAIYQKTPFKEKELIMIENWPKA
ncbi:MAG: valine--tRNA ligase [Parcubacteria group bacterium]|jgi:valyl-tRNA synthetase|nr:valine--tRNA ligase [Parcubacteria group bacterium]|tara:strand:+ start:1190 stop:3253 length:2064 start_codon:yes stop_codon:yes gene_type:complete